MALGRHADGFVVEAIIDAPVSQRTAWEVLTDFDHMNSIVNNLTSSKVIRREGNGLLVRQEGAVKYGPFTFPFWSEREVRLEPMAWIVVKQLSGSLRSFGSETRLDAAKADSVGQNPSVRITYRAEIVPDSFFARLLGGGFAPVGVEEQFRLLVAEMKRRDAKQSPVDAEKSVGEIK